MAFKRKTDTSGGEQFKFENKGQSLTGFYLGSFHFDGDYGPSVKHLFQTDKGIKVVFGQSHLTRLLEGEAVGALMRVTLEGTKKGNKGNPMKVYSLDIDDQQNLSSASLAEVSEQLSAETLDDTDIEDDEVSEDEVLPDEIKPVRAAPPARAATAPSPQRQRAVADMLSKNRRA